MVLRTIVSAELGWVTAGSTTSSFTAANQIYLVVIYVDVEEYLEEKYLHKYTVGTDKNGTPVFVHFSAQAASNSNISEAIL